MEIMSIQAHYFVRRTHGDGDTLGHDLDSWNMREFPERLLPIIERTCKSELRSDPRWQRRGGQRDNAMTKPDPFFAWRRLNVTRSHPRGRA